MIDLFLRAEFGVETFGILGVLDARERFADARAQPVHRAIEFLGLVRGAGVQRTDFALQRLAFVGELVCALAQQVEVEFERNGVELNQHIAFVHAITQAHRDSDHRLV